VLFVHLKNVPMKTEQQLMQDKIVLELRELDKETVDMGKGVRLKPSQCYSLDFYPKPHFLYNTNCPDELKNKLQTILKKYFEESL
jgi:hypothetical protein